MKIGKNFVLRQLAGKWVILSLSGQQDFTGMLTLNEAGVFLWKLLEKGADQASLSAALCKEYGILPELASGDTERFLQKLRDIGCLEG